MVIPAILPYPLPGSPDLPKNKVNWAPDPERAVLLIHDMQQYFIDPFDINTSPMKEVIANIKELRSKCHDLGIPVIYSAQPGGQKREQRALLQDFWGPGMDDGPYQKKIIDQLSPDEDDIVLTKWRYSAFRKTDLLDLLHQYGRDQLIVCGVYAHIGCLLTACDAFMLDVAPFFVADAVADFSQENHEMALVYAAERCAVTLSTKQLLGKLTKADGGTSGQPLSKERVREQVAGLLHEQPSAIGDHDNLVEVSGIDSVRIMAIAEKWRREGLDVNFIELAERPTIADWWTLLSSRSQKISSK